MNCDESLERLKQEFKECQSVLTAIGDETRQLIIIALMDAASPGIRVGSITAKTHLSRPAVSHHLKILKDAGIIGVYKQGTMNHYYLDPGQSALLRLKLMTEHIETLMQTCAQNNEQQTKEQ